jgi:hypothetical protein
VTLSLAALVLGDCEKERLPVMKDIGDLGYFFSGFELLPGDFDLLGDRPRLPGELERPRTLQLYDFFSSDGSPSLELFLLFLLKRSRKPLFVGVAGTSSSSSSPSLPETRELSLSS